MPVRGDAQAITSECDTRGHALASLSTRGSWETTSYDVLAVDCKGNSCVTKTATASASQCAKMTTRQQATSTYPTPRNPDGSWKISAKIGNFELKGGLNPAGTAPATPGFCRSTGGYTAFIARGDGPLFDGGIDCACKCEALPECQGFSWTGSRGLCNLAGSSFPTYHSPGATELNHPSHYTTEAIAKAYAEAADGIAGGSQPKGFGAECLFEQGKEEYIRAGAWPNTKSHYGEFNMQYKDNAPGLINSLAVSAGYSCYIHKDQEQRMTAGTTEGSRRSRSAPAPDTDTDTCSTIYSLTELPQFVNVDVTHVLLQDNQIAKLSNNSFAGLGKVEHVDLKNNDIAEIEPNSFAGLTSCKRVDLSDNDIPELVDNTFAGLENLISLDLSFNKIKELAATTFLGLGKVRFLDLSNNVIDAIVADTFAGVQKVTGLDLSNNAVASIEPNSFAGLSEVTSLDLSNNDLTDLVGNALAGLDKLESLLLPSNSFTAVPVLPAGNYKKIDLSDNSIGPTLQDTTFLDVKVGELDLANNTVERIEADTFLDMDIADLDMSGPHPLTFMAPTGLNGLEDLTSLKTGDNWEDAIKFIRQEFCKDAQKYPVASAKLCYGPAGECGGSGSTPKSAASCTLDSCTTLGGTRKGGKGKGGASSQCPCK